MFAIYTGHCERNIARAVKNVLEKLTRTGNRYECTGSADAAVTVEHCTNHTARISGVRRVNPRARCVTPNPMDLKRT
jgi:4-aminobutyrate aminotransferase-like enzyme